MRPKIELKAGSTFAYAGLVSGLDPSIAWGASANVLSAPNAASLGANTALTVTLAKASDFVTSSNWSLTLYAAGAVTSVWWGGVRNSGGVVLFDVKFFNTASPDPVIYSETVAVKLWPAVTP